MVWLKSTLVNIRLVYSSFIIKIIRYEFRILSFIAVLVTAIASVDFSYKKSVSITALINLKYFINVNFWNVIPG